MYDFFHTINYHMICILLSEQVFLNFARWTPENFDFETITKGILYFVEYLLLQ